MVRAARLRRAAAGRERPARARRRRERGALLGAARGGAAVAPGRACALGELAVRRRRGDRDALQPRARSSPSCRAAARRPRSAPTTTGRRGSSGSSGSASCRTTRASGGTSRPHPTLGTLEVRVADQPTALERTGCSSALVRDLVADAPPSERAARGDYLQNRWAAARAGLDATLLHPDGDERCRPARELRASCSASEPPEPEAHAQLAAEPTLPRTSSRGR